MFFKKRSIIGLNIEETSIQVAELEKAGKSYRVVAANRKLLPQGVIEEGRLKLKKPFTKILGELLETAKPKAIPKDSEVVLALPGHEIFLHTFKFPSKLSPKNIESVIAFQAEKVIPYNQEEIYWDFHVLPFTRKSTYQKVLYAAVPKATVASYYRALEDVKLKPILFCLESDALMRALLTEKKKDKRTHAILNIGYLGSNLTFIRDGNIRNASNVSGAKECTEILAKLGQMSLMQAIHKKDRSELSEKQFLEQVKPQYERLVRKLKQMVQYYQEKGSATDLSTVVISGQYHDLPGLGEYLSKNTDLHIEIGDPTVHLSEFQKIFIDAPEIAQLQSIEKELAPKKDALIDKKKKANSNPLEAEIQGINKKIFAILEPEEAKTNETIVTANETETDQVQEKEEKAETAGPKIPNLPTAETLPPLVDTQEAYEASFKKTLFSGAIGSAIRGLQKNYFYDGINLLPFEVIEQYKKNKILTFAKLCCPAILIFFSALAVYFSIAYQQMSYEKQDLENKSKNVKQIVESTRYKEIKQSIQDFNNELGVLNQIEGKCYPEVKLIREIQEILPETTLITSLNFSETDSNIRFSGVAKERNDIIHIQTTLQSLEHVSEVVSPVSNLDKRKNSSFEISIFYDPAKVKCHDTSLITQNDA